eukprot:127984_1
MERNTQVPKDLRDRPNTVHRRPLTIKPADDTLDDEDIKSDHQGVNTDKSPIQLKQYAPRPVSCNGDCGSQFAKMIHNLTHHETQQIKLDITEEQTIAHAFWLPDSPLRQTLIKQIQNQPILSNDDKYKDMLNKLKDQNLYIKGKEWTNDMTSFFRMLFEQQYIHILHTLANGTCLVPDSRSLFGEYAAYHKRKKERWIGELNRLNEELLNGNHSNDPQQLQKRRELQQKIGSWQPKSAKEDFKDLTRFEARLKTIKQREKYKIMDERNMALTDTEIYAVMVYCEDMVYEQFHKSQREPDKFNVSCEWKTLFYHLCCAVYKIREIFHKRNSDFKNAWITNRSPEDDKLYRGISGCHDVADKHVSHTISSFTYNPAIAFEFTRGSGMILAIPGAFRAIYNGTLMAADVSWLSGFAGEGEFLVTPIAFNQIRQVHHDPNSTDYDVDVRMDWNKVYVFEITDFKSETLEAIQYSTSQRIQDPMTALEALLPIKNKRTSNYIAAATMVGGFVLYVCRNCHVQWRLCEAATSLLIGNIECPACRALFAQYPQLNDGAVPPDTFECYNLDCKKKWIRHTDLLKVSENCHLGYRCRHCGSQQREALSRRYTMTSETDPGYLERVSEQLIHHIEECIKEINDGAQTLSLMEDKKEFMRLVSFIMDIERAEKKDTGNVFLKRPIIWKWITQFDGVRNGISEVLLKEGLKEQLNDLTNSGHETAIEESKSGALSPVIDIVEQATGTSIQNLLQNEKVQKGIGQLLNKYLTPSQPIINHDVSNTHEDIGDIEEID